MSGLKDVAKLGTVGRGTLAGGHAAVLDLNDLFGVFALKRRDWRALAFCLAHLRYEGVVILDGRSRPQRIPRKGPTVGQRVLVAEIDGLKAGHKQKVQELRRDGYAADRIVNQTNISRKQVQAIMDGRDISDEAAAALHLVASGRAKLYRSKEALKDARQALKTRLSRARAAMRSDEH